MVCASLVAAQALVAGAARVLGAHGVLYLYGPFRRGGAHTASTNELFDMQLKSRNPEWGVRDLEAVADLAADAGFTLEETIAMPANNLSLVFRNGAMRRG